MSVEHYSGEVFSSHPTPDNSGLIIEPNRENFILNTTLTPRIERDLDQILNGVNHYIFDFSEVSYLSSAVMRELQAFRKKKELIEKSRSKPTETQEVTIISSPKAYDVLKLAAFDEEFNVVCAFDKKT